MTRFRIGRTTTADNSTSIPLVRKPRHQTGQGLVHNASLYEQLKQRRVFHAVSFYAVASWGLVLGAAELLPVFGVSDLSIRWLVIGAVGLLPLVATLSWFFRLTPRGLVPESEVVVTDQTIVAPLQQGSFVMAQWLGHQRRYFNGFVIGRDPGCELRVDDEQVSRRHAAVSLEEGRWWLQDLNSRNGTMVNGELIHRIELPEVANVVLYQGGPELELRLERDDDATRVAR